MQRTNIFESFEGLHSPTIPNVDCGMSNIRHNNSQEVIGGNEVHVKFSQ